MTMLTSSFVVAHSCSLLHDHYARVPVDVDCLAQLDLQLLNLLFRISVMLLLQAGA